MNVGSTLMCFGAVDFNGQHVFRTCISDTFSTYDSLYDYEYTEIVQTGNNILFVNAGVDEQVG